ncbi:YcaO-like family protein [Pullulanibacillus sp. KACC 23026]|uniref:YcaO-like family protein n=1 Tax=Pullulanibacillus sp. KACC 23026 TaxID=3028315 RepID=UPI0023B20172|nr:YcaO-like family protein [Pullulanibacillus sp. KACC 23026]WEG13652.1 YcaO-like family protein [Pullulanibacillus sp. KACC 23026]
MFHKFLNHNTYKFPIDIFRNSPRFALVSQGNYLIDGRVGPDAGLTLGFDKMNTMIRAIGEATERRCTMLQLESDKIYEDMVETWDLVNSRKDYLERKYTRFLKGLVDTTGSAVHTNSNIAIYNALKELLEKNSLFLFWYGKQGKKIKKNLYYNNTYYRCFKNSGFEVSVFINDFFTPLKTVIVLSYKENDQYICGLGTDVNISTAIEHAFEEAFLIGGTRYYWMEFGNNFEENIWANKEYVEYTKYLDCVDYSEIYENPEDVYERSIINLISGIPNFVKKIHLIYKEQHLVSNLKYARVYSKELFNCLPLKRNICIDVLINKETLNLETKSLSLIPDCPMS